MFKIGTTVRLPDGGTGTIDRTSIRTGVKLYRVGDRWFEKGDLGRGR